MQGLFKGLFIQYVRVLRATHSNHSVQRDFITPAPDKFGTDSLVNKVCNVGFDVLLLQINKIELKNKIYSFQLT